MILAYRRLTYIRFTCTLLANNHACNLHLAYLVDLYMVFTVMIPPRKLTYSSSLAAVYQSYHFVYQSTVASPYYVLLPGA